MINCVRVSFWCVLLWMLMACGGVQWNVIESVNVSESSPSMDNEEDLQVLLRVNGSQWRFLNHGEVLKNGDRIQLMIQAREKIHVYVAHCSRNGKRAWISPQSGMMTKLRAAVAVPAPYVVMVIDDNIGPDFPYVVVSRVELPSTDLELAKTMEASKRGRPVADCKKQPSESDKRRPRFPSYESRQQQTAIPSRSKARAGRAEVQGTSSIVPATDRSPPPVEKVRVSPSAGV